MTQQSEATPWYRRAIVGVEVGPTGAQSGVDRDDGGFVARFSGSEIVERCVQANAEYLVLWALDGEFAYYDSRHMPKAPGLGARDVLREGVEAARARGLPIIAYCQMQYPAHFLRENPEFRMRDRAGDAIEGRVCFNSGYMRQAQAVAAEMLAYGIDGFHFDMMDQGLGPPYGCWCSHCQARFEAEHGRPMPTEMAWDADWERMLEFRYNTSARFETELREFVRAQNPKATVDYNYHGSPPFNWEVGQKPVQHAHLGDFVTGECGLWAFGALQASLVARFLAATKPDAVSQMVMQRSVRSYHDMTTRPLADLRWEALTLLAHGAQVTIVDKLPYDGATDRVTYERIGAVFAEARSKREHFGQPPVQEVGLYYSCPSRDWYGKEMPDAYQRAFVGAHKALVYAHIPFGVLLDENLTAESLRQFRVVYLPNAAVLSENESALLQEYVRNGGHLLATGLTGLYGPHGEERKECVLSDLIGARLIARLPGQDNHVALPAVDALLSQDIPPDWPFLVYGPAAIFEATTATGYGQLYRPHRTLRQRKGTETSHLPMSADAPVGPAILINTYGKGKVVYLPCSPDTAAASDYAMAEPRLLLRNLLRALNPAPEVEIDAPLNVEAVVTDDAASRRLRIHLISYLTPAACTAPRAGSLRPSMMEEAPLYRAKITLRRAFGEVSALHPATRITTLSDGVQVEVEDIHEVVIVGY